MNPSVEKKVLVLAGMPASGKTALGFELSKRFQWEFVDLDSLIEQESGSTIENLIRVDGIEKFRDLESLTLVKFFDREGLNSGSSSVVLSVGGGTLGNQANLGLILGKANLVVLDVGVKEGSRRAILDEKTSSAKGDDGLRPLLIKDRQKDETIEDLVERNYLEIYKSRKSLFRDVLSGVKEGSVFYIKVDGLSVFELANMVHSRFGVKLESSKQGISSVFTQRGKFGGFVSDVVVIDSDLARFFLELGIALGDLSLGLPNKIAVVSDSKVWEVWGEKFSTYLGNKGILFESIIVDSGEKSKSLNNLELLCSKLLSLGFQRKDVLIAFGGGVVGDLAGFVASVYMRGIKLIQLPTTIVAQVDSAIGGKTGVNLPAGKNMVGTFYPGSSVISNLEFLESLSDREYFQGIAEVIKYGLIWDAKFFEFLEANIQKIKDRDRKVLFEIVRRCSEIKLEVVSGDLLDLSGLRAILNFGHTVGHAIEKLAGYGKYLHGEAISIGMLKALKLGISKGVTKTDLLGRTEDLLKAFNLPTELSDELILGGKDYLKFRSSMLKDGAEVSGEHRGAFEFYQKWSSVISSDKKGDGEKVNFVFVEEIGKTKVSKVEVGEIVDVL